MTVLGGMAAILAGVPFIVSERCSSKAYPGTWKDSLRVRIGKRAAAIVSNSKSGREYWTDRTNCPITLIRNGIPFDEIAATSPISVGEARLTNGAKLILYAGRFEAQKNLASLVPALQHVLTCNNSAVAGLFGEGALRKEVIRSAGALDFGDRFRVMDFTTSLWRWVKRANVFVSLSLYEGNPNTVLEAVACGCPVVLSDIPQHREILDDDSAYFVPASSPPKAAEAILRVLMNPDEATQKAERAREKIAAYSVEASVDQYLSLYTRLIVPVPH
jgi:glycosyltransferase involved in cell wall biosynthesis